MAPEAITQLLPAALREHLRDANALPEHRPVTVAFIRYGGTDALIENQGTGDRGRRVAAAGDGRAIGGRSTRRRIPRLRRRHRRRQVDPDRGCTKGHRRRRGAHAARVASDRGRQASAPHPYRRESRRGFRRRRRSRVSAYVHGDGRRSEPRRAADGAVRTGGAGGNLCDGRRTRPIEDNVRDNRARAVQREGQGGAGTARGRSAARRARAAADGGAAAAAHRPQRRARRHSQGVHERARRRGPDGRGRRRGGRRQDSAPRSAARRGRGLPQTARVLRSVHGVHAVRRLAELLRESMGFGRDDPDAVDRRATAWRSVDAHARPPAHAAAHRDRVRRRRGNNARGRDARRERTGARSCTRPSAQFLAGRWCPSGARRDRERAPHGRGVSGTARAPRR